MRLPNNYGSISKLSGNRRNPYMVKIHCGTDEFGKRTRKALGYYKTRKEAFAALSKYNEKPYDLTKNKPTFKDIFDSWYTPHVEGKSKSLKVVYQSAFKSWAPLHDRIFEELRPFDFDRIIKPIQSSKQKKTHMAVLINQMYRQAIKMEIMDKDYSKYVELGISNEAKPKNIYSEHEIRRISKMNGFIPDSLMILLFTGMRIGELLSLEDKNINLVEKTFLCGSKTEAGKNRIVPIHPAIEKIVEFYAINKYFICGKSKVSYSTYLKMFTKFKNELGLNHTIHETRHTFITLMDEAGAQTSITQLIVGHVQSDITDRVYTHSTIGKLRHNILLLSNF